MTCNFRTIIADTAPETLGTASMFNCLFDLLRLYHIEYQTQHQERPSELKRFIFGSSLNTTAFQSCSVQRLCILANTRRLFICFVASFDFGSFSFAFIPCRRRACRMVCALGCNPIVSDQPVLISTAVSRRLGACNIFHRTRQVSEGGQLAMMEHPSCFFLSC